MTPLEFSRLQELDACVIANAIERFDVRPRNEGFARGSVQCRFPHLPPMLGYAVTARIRTLSAPMAGRCYYDRMDWWRHMLATPEPRIIVLQDVDDEPGLGALIGEIHVQIARALGCKGCVTNGAVRDLHAVEALGFPLFSGRVSVSHAYAHIVDYGTTVEIGGLQVSPGDLVHGDRHGVQTIPLEIAAGIPRMADDIEASERGLIARIESPEFSIDGLEKEFDRR